MAKYDPQSFPERGPFFQGWYIRITDYERGESLGVMFGMVLPRDPQITDKLVMVSFLRSDGQNRLKSYERFFDAGDLEVTAGATEGPDGASDPSGSHFSWRVKDCGVINVTPAGTSFSFTIGTVTFRGQIGAPVPWDSAEQGPEGWLYKLPLPLAWFVYSVGSDTEFTWHDSRTGEDYSGKGLAHMETNWGKGFPTAWFWAQGIRHADRVSFAMSGGPLAKLGPFSLRGHLIGYRNPDKNISLDYRNADFSPSSLLRMEKDTSHGVLDVSVEGPLHKLSISMKAPVGTFSDRLYGPEENGFTRDCSESFKARAEIVVYRRLLPMVGTFNEEVDRQVIEGAALEFGGAFLCESLCDPTPVAEGASVAM